jgi:predicted DNA binding CopG/RHH family protein
MARKLKKKLPVLLTDEAAIAFAENADLSEYDLSGFIPSAEFFDRVDKMRKTAPITIRLPQYVIDTFKAEATASGEKYQTLIRTLLEKAVRERTGAKKVSPRGKKAA